MPGYVVCEDRLEAESEAEAGGTVGAGVGDTVGTGDGDSVGAEFGDSVGAGVGGSVGAGVGDPVGAGLGDSVGAGVFLAIHRNWIYSLAERHLRRSRRFWRART